MGVSRPAGAAVMLISALAGAVAIGPASGAQSASWSAATSAWLTGNSSAGSTGGLNTVLAAVAKPRGAVSGSVRRLASGKYRATVTVKRAKRVRFGIVTKKMLRFKTMPVKRRSRVKVLLPASLQRLTAIALGTTRSRRSKSVTLWTKRLPDTGTKDPTDPGDGGDDGEDPDPPFNPEEYVCNFATVPKVMSRLALPVIQAYWKYCGHHLTPGLEITLGESTPSRCWTGRTPAGAVRTAVEVQITVPMAFDVATDTRTDFAAMGRANLRVYDIVPGSARVDANLNLVWQPRERSIPADATPVTVTIPYLQWGSPDPARNAPMVFDPGLAYQHTAHRLLSWESVATRHHPAGYEPAVWGVSGARATVNLMSADDLLTMSDDEVRALVTSTRAGIATAEVTTVPESRVGALCTTHAVGR